MEQKSKNNVEINYIKPTIICLGTVQDVINDTGIFNPVDSSTIVSGVREDTFSS